MEQLKEVLEELEGQLGFELESDYLKRQSSDYKEGYTDGLSQAIAILKDNIKLYGNNK